jgi:hypothetical protein
MFVCQWHLDLAYGKQGDALALMRAWGAEQFASPKFRVVHRILDERPS